MTPFSESAVEDHVCLARIIWLAGQVWFESRSDGLFARWQDDSGIIPGQRLRDTLLAGIIRRERWWKEMEIERTS
jgi:hypothetical protein